MTRPTLGSGQSRGACRPSSWRVHAGLHRTVGTVVLRPGVRIRCVDTTARQARAGTTSGGVATVARSTSDVPQVRHPRGGNPVCPLGRRHSRVPLPRTVQDVHAERATRPCGRCWRFFSSRCCSSATSIAATCARSGLVLGLLAVVSIFRIKRWNECETCKVCEKACDWGAIQGPKISLSECVRCDDCERLYEDKTVCPHWFILERRTSPRAPSHPPA